MKSLPIGIKLLIIAPKVPPKANALIPKNTNTNVSIMIIAIIINIMVNNPEDIPRKSNDIFVFLDLRYSIAFANSLSFKLSI